MSSYTLCIGLRWLQWIIINFENNNEKENGLIFPLRICNTFIERLKWFILFFFIFEMEAVHIKLKSSSVGHF